MATIEIKFLRVRGWMRWFPQLLALAVLPVPGKASDSGVYPFHTTLVSPSGNTAPSTSTMILFTDQDSEAERRASPGRLFGVACAHATVGNSWKMGSNDLVPESIKGSVTYPLCDLTLFEIDPNRVPGTRAADLKPFGAIREGLHEEPGLIAYDEAVQAWARSQGGFLDSSDAFLPVETSLGIPAAVLAPSWSDRSSAEPATHRSFVGWGSLEIGVNAPTEDFSTAYLGKARPGALFGDSSGRRVMASAFADQMTAPVRLAPGMSCSPMLKPVAAPIETKDLFQRKNAGVPQRTRWWFEVLGFGTEFQAGMNGSTFCSAKALLKMLSKYEQGKHQAVGPGTWKYKESGPYMEYGPGRSDWIPPNTPAGRGTGVPPGRGTGVPPSNAAESAALGPADSLNEAVEIEWNHTPSVGFLVGNDAIPLFPSRQGIALVLQNEDALRVKSLPTGSSLQASLAARTGIKSPYFFATPGGFHPALGPGVMPEVESRPDGSIHFVIYGEKPGNERIEFTLTSSGALQGGTDHRFRPVIEVSSDQGNRYRVDLKEFFFVDPYSLSVPADDSRDSTKLSQFSSASKELRKSVLDRVLRYEAARGPVLSYRKVGEDVSVRLRFSKVAATPGLEEESRKGASSRSCGAALANSGVFAQENDLRKVLEACRDGSSGRKARKR